MSAINDNAPARRPVLVVTPDELEHYYHELLSPPIQEGRGYSERFGWKKTDLAANPATAVTASRQVLGGDVREIGGWSITETTGAAVASVRIRDGSAAIAEVVARISLAASGGSFIMPTTKGIEIATGRIFLEVIAGSVEGVIYWR